MSTQAPIMKSLNFVPKKIQQRQQAGQFMVVLFLGLIIGGGLGGAAYAAATIQTDSASSQLTFALERNESRAKAITKEREKASLSHEQQQRVTLLNQWASQELDWNKAIQGVAEVVNKDITLSQLSLVPSEKPGLIQVSTAGNAPSNVSFAEYLEALKGNKQLTNLSIDSYSYDISKGSVSFTIGFTIDQKLYRFQQGGAK